jgi:hypothetical protein
VTVHDIPLDVWRNHIFPLIASDNSWMSLRRVPLLWKKLAQCFADIQENFISNKTTDNDPDPEVESLTSGSLAAMLCIYVDFVSKRKHKQFTVSTDELSQITQQMRKVAKLVATAPEDSTNGFVYYLLQFVTDSSSAPPYFVESMKSNPTLKRHQYMPIRLLANRQPEVFHSLVRSWFKHLGTTKDMPAHISQFASGSKHGLRAWPLFSGVGFRHPCVVPSWITEKVRASITSKAIQLVPLVSILVLSKTCSIAMRDTFVASDLAEVFCSPVGSWFEVKDALSPDAYRCARFLDLWKDILSDPEVSPHVRKLVCQSVKYAYDIEVSVKNPGFVDWLDVLSDDRKAPTLNTKMVSNILTIAKMCSDCTPPLSDIALRIAQSAAQHNKPEVLSISLPECSLCDCPCKEDVPWPLSDWVTTGYLTILSSIVTHGHKRLLIPFIEHVKTTGLSMSVPVIYSYLHIPDMHWDDDALASARSILYNPTILAILTKQTNVQAIIHTSFRKSSRRKSVESDKFPYNMAPLLSGAASDLLQDIARSPRTWVECVLNCIEDDIEFRCGLLFAYLDVVISRLSQPIRDDIFDAIVAGRIGDFCIPHGWVSTFLSTLNPSFGTFYEYSGFIFEHVAETSSSEYKRSIIDYLSDQLSRDPYSPQLVAMTTEAVRSLKFHRVTLIILPAAKKLGRFRPSILEYYQSLCKGIAHETKKCLEAFGQNTKGVDAFLNCVNGQ